MLILQPRPLAVAVLIITAAQGVSPECSSFAYAQENCGNSEQFASSQSADRQRVTTGGLTMLQMQAGVERESVGEEEEEEKQEESYELVQKEESHIGAASSTGSLAERRNRILSNLEDGEQIIVDDGDDIQPAMMNDVPSASDTASVANAMNFIQKARKAVQDIRHHIALVGYWAFSAQHRAALVIGILMITLVLSAFVFSDTTHVPNIFYRKGPMRKFVIDAMTYETTGLSNWSVFHAYSNTVWEAENLWGMMRNLGMVSILVAFAEVLLAKDPTDLDPLRFAKIGIVLNVFVALLLGFLLSSSVNKWWCCIDGFLHSFNSLRNLQMQLHALGVEQKKIDICLRYGILAGWLLVAELRMGAHLDETTKLAAEKQMFDNLANKEKCWRVEPEERAVLESITGQRPAMMWMWIGSFIGRMAQDGDVPPMQSPTYGRIVNLAQDAQHGMRQVRSAIQVQMPFVYIHTLSTIVQVNNLLAAVSYGLTLGVAVSAILVSLNPSFRLYDVEPKVKATRSLMEHTQALMIQTFQCFVGPIIYQSFLEIGVAISHPFAHEEYGVFPVESMLTSMEKDMTDCNRVVVDPPAWERPCYKK